VHAEARRGAIAFLCAIEDACAGRIERAPGGCAILDPRHPRLWDANHLRVEAPPRPTPWNWTRLLACTSRTSNFR
jgi:hypothetical protein